MEDIFDEGFSDETLGACIEVHKLTAANSWRKNL